MKLAPFNILVLSLLVTLCASMHGDESSFEQPLHDAEATLLLQDLDADTSKELISLAEIANQGSEDQATENNTFDTENDADEKEKMVVSANKQAPSLVPSSDMLGVKQSLQLRPQLAIDDPEDKIEAQFENADLSNVLDWVSQTFKVLFISGDILNPKLASKISDNKITFRTHEPLTKQAMWDLFLAFLDLIDRTLVPQSYVDGYPAAFKIVITSAEKGGPFPVFMGTDWKQLPDDDTKIRYIYFIENSTLEVLQPIAESLRSKNSTLTTYAPQKALIIADKAANVRSLMHIISELDSVSLPEMMQVIKLKHADAKEVVDLWNSIIAKEKEPGPGGLEARLFPAKKIPTSIYFAENTRLIAETQSNSLIVFGTKAGIQKIEDFIAKYVDTSIKAPYSPLYIYELQYSNATDTANILNAVVTFDGGSKDAAAHGGVRDGDKYFRKGITIIPEQSGNRLLIRAEKDDYIKIEQILKTLDVKQPQIAIEVLIVEIDEADRRELGAQLRNKQFNSFENNIDFQTSGLPGSRLAQGVVVNPLATANRSDGNLLGNLISLAAGQNIGSTLVSIGNSVTGVWAVLKILQTYVHANVVSHPFLITTNNYTAQVQIGQTRRVVTGTVTGATGTLESQDDIEAALKVAITPQINSNGIITLAINIDINTFALSDNFTSAATDTKKIVTSANVANKEVLALGGLVKTTMTDQLSKVPILGDVPLFGWFFKNKVKIEAKSNLIVFICPQIIEPRLQGGISSYAGKKTKFAKQIMKDTRSASEKRDPIHRWFFRDKVEEQTHYVDDFTTKKYHGDHSDIATSEFYNPPTIHCAGAPLKNTATPEQPSSIHNQERRVLPRQRASLTKHIVPRNEVSA